MHFSQGWVQFGYRFSNDSAPFALLLVALGMRAAGAPACAGACRSRHGLLVAVSIAINLWGVVWSRLLGW